MTDQSNLDLIWAGGGGVVDPGDAKYVLGWVSEIPTYENFNFVLQTTTTNLLAMAEANTFDWQADITYQQGARVFEGSKMHTCITGNINQQPSLDTTNSYWVKGQALGGGDVGNLNKLDGVTIESVNTRTTTNWDGNDLTVKNSSGILSMATDDGTKNWLLANIAGSLVFADVDNIDVPDGRPLSPGNPGIYEIYHEGNPPPVSAGGVEEAPINGITYGRNNGTWLSVSGTIVAESPPLPTGSTNYWYNLLDGQLYIDLNDGDSFQWVMVSPPVLPLAGSLVVFYHDTIAAALLASQQDGGEGLHVAPEVAPALVF